MKKEERKTLQSILAESDPKPGRYYDGPGGNGLSLLIKKTKTPGVLSKTWSVQIQINGKYTNRELGSYSKVKLAKARRRALAYHPAAPTKERRRTAMRRTRIRVPSSPGKVESPAIVKPRDTVLNEGEGITVPRIPAIVAQSKNAAGAISVKGQRMPDADTVGPAPGGACS